MKETLIRTELAVAIYKIFQDKNISQTEFGKILGIRQAKVSRLLGGCLQNEFSVEMLIVYLQKLGKYVKISID